MNFKKLLYFKTIVEQGQISRAARVLHISQPPLSQRLKELEEELGTTLIERTGNNWKVTLPGKALYQRALQVLELLDDIPSEVKQAQMSVQGQVTVGCSTMCLSLLHRFIPWFSERYPEISIRLFIGDSAILNRMLRERALDFSVMLAPHPPLGLVISLLPQVELRVVIPRRLATSVHRNAASRDERLALDELAKLPLILPRRFEGGSVHGRILDLMAYHGLKPWVVMDCPDCTAIMGFMEVDMAAAAVIPETEIPDRFHKSHVVCRVAETMPVLQPCVSVTEKRYLSRAAVITRDELNEFTNIEHEDHSLDHVRLRDWDPRERVYVIGPGNISGKRYRIEGGACPINGYDTLPDLRASKEE